MTNNELLNFVTLDGGFKCELSVREQNEWTQYCLRSCEFKNYLEQQLRVKQLESMPYVDVQRMSESYIIVQRISEFIKAKLAMFELSKIWHKEMLLKRVERIGREQEHLERLYNEF